MSEANANLGVAAKARAAMAKKKNGGNDTAVANVPKTLMGQKSNQILGLFNQYAPMIGAVVQSGMSVERLIGVGVQMVVNNPDLAKCTTPSIVGAMMQTAIINLDPSPALQYVYFVPYWNRDVRGTEVQFQLGYRGMLTLLRRTGEVLTAYSHVVYANDEFDYQLGMEPTIEHKPTLGERGELYCVYAIIKFANGTSIIEVMTRKEIEHIRNNSKSYKDRTGKINLGSPWNQYFGEMARKTVLRRAMKTCPIALQDDEKNLQLQTQLESDEHLFDANTFDASTKTLPAKSVNSTEAVEATPSTPNKNEAGDNAIPFVDPASSSDVETEKVETEKVKTEKVETEKVETETVDKATQSFIENCQAWSGKFQEKDAFELYQQTVGNLGYESISQVPKSDFGKLLNALNKAYKELS